VNNICRIKIMSIVGARPNFMKIAPISNAIIKFNESNATETIIDHVIVHTGQHYDAKMSTMFFVELGIPIPDVNLEVGSGTHAMQTSEIMRRFEPVILEYMPDVLLVVGDVNSTIACTLVAAKIEYPKDQERKRPVIVHVEAGLRSFDMEMPEEINRILTDAISDILFTTEAAGNENLLRAGVAKEHIHFVGNVMIDTLLAHRERAALSPILANLQIKPQQYAVVTLHRPSNVDDYATFGGIMSSLNEIALDLPVIFPIHPRTKKRLAEWQIFCSDAIRFVEPLGYIDFLKLVSEARIVLTDSGGIQEETTVLGVPCITLRNNTERPVTVTDGTNHLAGVEPEAILKIVNQVLTNWQKPDKLPALWDGKAAERIVAALASDVLGRRS